MNKKTLYKFMEKISNYNNDPFIIIKGSASLYLWDKLKREPNDIDIIYNNDYSPDINNYVWNEITKDFLIVKEVSNNNLIKSKIIGWNKKLIQFEWTTKNHFYEIFGTKWFKNIWILNPVIATYDKFKQLYVMILRKSNENLELKKKNVFDDINNLLNDDEIFSILKNNINEIMDIFWKNDFFSGFASLDGHVAILGFPKEKLKSLLKSNFEEIDLKIKNKILEINENVNEKNKKINAFCSSIIKEKDQILKMFMEENSSIYFVKENIFYFKNKENLETIIIKILNKFSNNKIFKEKINFKWKKVDIYDYQSENIIQFKSEKNENSISIEQILKFIIEQLISITK